jgi:hypothetical protein
MKWAALLVALLVLLVGCSCNAPEGSPSTGAGTDAGTVAPKPSAPDPSCGMKITDWCPSPPGDPCGQNKDVASCKADARCKGMRYQGESVVACQLDDRGFATNCPTVGCVSR